jgi:hypothetical protein
MRTGNGPTSQINKVVVAGDLIWDFNLVQQPVEPARHHEPLRSTVLYPNPGGAWYLKDLVDLACSDIRGSIQVKQPSRDDRACLLGNVRLNHAYQVWTPFDRVKDGKGKVWRIDRFLGCHAVGESAPSPMVEHDTATPDLLVIDDQHLGFSQDMAAWPAALREGRPKAIILKTTSVPDRGDRMWKRLLEPYFADRLTVVISATLLRVRGAAISTGLSWDRTIEEIATEFETGLSSRDFARCRRVIVHFGGAGVACFSREPHRWGTRGGSANGPHALTELAWFDRFLYHPEEVEDVWQAQRPGATFGAASILTAALARQQLDPASYPLFIALGRGLAAIKLNHEVGCGDATKEFGPRHSYPELAGTFHPRKGRGRPAEPATQYRSAFTHPGLADPVLGAQPAAKSDLLRDVTGVGYEYVAAKATEVVIRGVDKALEAAPKARYGKYVTVDREEIERINAIRNLITSYRDNPNDSHPLSIAVFGPPGSGKSFAVDQLAAELFGEQKAKLTFNLARATDEELHMSFHQVRDACLHGRIPLVFWDEFDAQNLKWLQYFLEPMQDGTFTEQSIVHPLGRAIFVFAGGMCPDFESFDRSTDEGAAGASFRASKGPDFLSRLRGFVSIKGPNPAALQACAGRPALPYAEAAWQDPAHLIRRAVMLRVALEQSCPQLIDSKTGKAAISSGVIQGFLRVENYLHGARSLAAIVTMSSPGQGPYNVASLPSRDLLRLHVSDDFMDHVAAGELEVPEIESLAKACHEAWLKQKRKDGWTLGPRSDRKKTNPILMQYDKLDDEGKEANRKSARVVRAKLLEVGYRIVRLAPSRAAAFRRFPDDDRNRLMEIEHDIWLRDRLVQGWDWAPRARGAVRLHRDVTRFCAVPRKDQVLDHAIVSSIPDALRSSGYTLVKLAGSRAPRPQRRARRRRAKR